MLLHTFGALNPQTVSRSTGATVSDMNSLQRSDGGSDIQEVLLGAQTRQHRYQFDVLGVDGKVGHASVASS